MRTLSAEEASAAYQFGLERFVAARQRKGHHRFGWTPRDEVEQHYDGMAAVSEQTVAAATNRRWTSNGFVPDPRDAGDLEGKIGVRWTEHEHGCLIVHEDEHPAIRQVLVVGTLYPLRIAGWIRVQDAWQREWWRTDVRHPAYFVPQACLRHISELVKR